MKKEARTHKHAWEVLKSYTAQQITFLDARPDVRGRQTACDGSDSIQW